MLEFSEKGFAATRLEDVAARAGVVKGTIYLYFDNKEALFRAAVRSNVLPAIDSVTHLLDAYQDDTESLLRLAFQTIYARLISGEVRIILRIVLAEGPRFPEILEFYHANTISVAKRLIRRILERGVARGEFRADLDVEQPLVVAAPAIVAGLWMTTFDRLEPLDIEAYSRAHADIIMNGLLRRP